MVWIFSRDARQGRTVTFNSRARRRPICVVRAPITPDKIETIYLPSVEDAITRLCLSTFPLAIRRKRRRTRTKDNERGKR